MDLFSIEEPLQGQSRPAQQASPSLQGQLAPSPRARSESCKQLKSTLTKLGKNPLRREDNDFKAFLKKVEQVGEAGLSPTERENLSFISDRERFRKKKQGELAFLKRPDFQQSWLFPESTKAHRYFYAQNLPMAQSLVDLLMRTIRLAEDIRLPSLQGAEMGLFPLSYTEGGQFEMWFTNNELFLGSKSKTKIRSRRVGAPQRTSSQEEEEDSEDSDHSANLDLTHESQSTDLSDDGKIYGRLSVDAEHSSLGLSSCEETPLSGSEYEESRKRKKKKKKKGRRKERKEVSCRTLQEEAQARYMRYARDIRERVLRYQAFRKLLVNLFGLYGWDVSFERCAKPCHRVGAGKSVIITEVENAWPRPETYLLCHHEKVLGSGFTSFQLPKQAEEIHFWKMVVVPSSV